MKTKHIFFKLTVYLLTMAMFFIGIPVTSLALENDSNEDDTNSNIIDMEDYFDVDGMKIYINNKPYDITSDWNDTDVTISKGDTVSILLVFCNVKVRQGQEVQYQIPSSFLKNISETTTPILNDSKEDMGTTYIQEDGLIRFVPDSDYIKKHQDSDGYLTLLESTVLISGQISDSIGNDPTTHDNTIYIGTTAITLPIDYSDYYSKVDIQKLDPTFNPLDKTLTYTINVENVGTEDSTNVIVEDVFDREIKPFLNKSNSSIYSKVGASKGTIDDTSSKLTWNVGTLTKGEIATLTYVVSLSDSYFDAPKNVTNTAVVTWGKLGSNTATTTNIISGVINISKEKDDIYIDSNDNTRIRYKVTVSTPASNTGSMDNVRVEDVIENASFIEGYNIISNDIDENVTFDNSTLDWNIGTMLPNESKTLIYEIVINPECFVQANTNGSVVKTVKNTATVYSNDSPYGQATISNSITKQWIGKTGKWIPSENRMMFTITLNKASSTVAVLENIKALTDTLTGNFKFYGNIAIKVMDSDSNVVDTISIPFNASILSSNGKTFTINFDDYTITNTSNDIVSLSGKYQYEITYYALPTDDSTIVKNVASVTIDTKYSYGSYSDCSWVGNDVIVTKTYTRNFKITKKFIGGTLDNVRWQTVIDSDIIPKGTLFKDYDPTSHNSSNEEWFANNSISFSQETLNISITDGDGNALPESAYRVEFPDSMKNNYYSGSYRGFYIWFDENVKCPVTIEYSNNINTSQLTKDGESCDYKNRSAILVDDIRAEATASFKYTYHDSLKKSVGDMDWTDSTLVWYVELNDGSLLNGDGQLVEYIPEGLEFQSAEIVEYGQQAYQTTLGNVTIATPTEEQSSAGIGQIVTIPVKNLYQEDELTNLISDSKLGYIKIKVTTQLVDDDLLYGKDSNELYTGETITVDNGVTKVFVNTVDFIQGNSTISASDSIELTNSPLTKTANLNINTRPYVEYTIDINPNSVDMSSGDTISIIDQMSDNMNLSLDDVYTLKVEKIEKNVSTDITNQCVLRISNGGHGFTLEVPDNTHIKVTYWVTISGYKDEIVEIYNSVSYSENPTDEVKSVIDNVVVMEALATSYIDTYIRVLKVDYDGNVIPNTEFKLYKVIFNEDGNPKVDDSGNPVLEYVSTKTTNEYGLIDFARLNKKELYVLEEVSAPDGYIIGSSSAKQYIQFQEHQTFKDTFDDIEVKGILNYSTITVYNDYSIASVDIPIEKTFVNIKILPEDVSSETFYFELVADDNNINDCYVDRDMSIRFTDDTIAISGLEKSNGYTKIESFNTIYFNQSGIYSFSVRELALSDIQVENGYTYDDVVYDIIVSVKNDSIEKGLYVDSILISSWNMDEQLLMNDSLPIFTNGRRKTRDYTTTPVLTETTTEETTTSVPTETTTEEFSIGSNTEPLVSMTPKVSETFDDTTVTTKLTSSQTILTKGTTTSVPTETTTEVTTTSVPTETTTEVTTTSVPTETTTEVTTTSVPTETTTEETTTSFPTETTTEVTTTSVSTEITTEVTTTSVPTETTTEVTTTSVPTETTTEETTTSVPTETTTEVTTTSVFTETTTEEFSKGSNTEPLSSITPEVSETLDDTTTTTEVTSSQTTLTEDTTSTTVTTTQETTETTSIQTTVTITSNDISSDITSTAIDIDSSPNTGDKQSLVWSLLIVTVTMLLSGVAISKKQS